MFRVAGDVQCPPYSFHYPGIFPSGTQGFLYVCQPPIWASVYAASLRFRITRNPDPTSFDTGHDLRYYGLPWAVPLIYGSLSRMAIRTLIHHDKLIPAKDFPQFLHRQENLKQGPGVDLPPEIPCVYAQNQPFVVQFYRRRTQLLLLDNRGLHGRMCRVSIPSPMESSRGDLEKALYTARQGRQQFIENEHMIRERFPTLLRGELPRQFPIATF